MGEVRKNLLHQGEDLAPVFTALYRVRKTAVISPFANGMEAICGVDDETEFTPDELFSRAWHTPEVTAPSPRTTLHSIQTLKAIRNKASHGPLSPMQDRDKRIHEIVLLQFVMNSMRTSLRENPEANFERIPDELVEYVHTAATEYFYQDFTARYDVDTLVTPYYKPTLDWIDRFVRGELLSLAHAGENKLPFWQSAKNSPKKGFGLLRFYSNMDYFVQGMYQSKDPEILEEFPRLVYFLNGHSRTHVVLPHIYREPFMSGDSAVEPSDKALSAALQFFISQNISFWERSKLLALINDNRVIPPYGKALFWLRNEVRTNPAVQVEMTPFNRGRQRGTRDRQRDNHPVPVNSQPSTIAEVTPDQLIAAAGEPEKVEPPRPAGLPVRSYLKGQTDEKATSILTQIVPYIPEGKETLVIDYFMGEGTFREQLALTDETITVLRQMQDNVLNGIEKLDAETRQLFKSILHI